MTQMTQIDGDEVERVKVLIVGGGVVGLSASLFLAQHGVPSLLVERHAGTSIHPRARGVSGRTMELLRGLGLEAAARKAGEAIAPSMGVYKGRTLSEVMASRRSNGLVIRWLRERMMRGEGSPKSPTSPCRVTQDHLEPVLLEAARARGVDARFSTELVELTQDAEGVTATLLDRGSGARRRARADYVIAADGARSPVRTSLGVGQSGRGVLTHQLNLYFRADLTELVRGREFSMCLVEDGDLRGLFASVNNTDLWVLHVPFDPEKGERAEDFGRERCAEIIRRAAGIPDLAVELKGVMPWQSAVRVADGFRHGRVFLAGDAAHVMPPWGGFGANTGIQDAHNLAWKLAAVLAGRAGEGLLDTYDVERRPVARAVADIAGDMNDERGLMTGRSGLAMLWTMRRAFPYFVVGYGYASEAVILDPGAPPGPGATDLRGRPGTRAPHVWLSRQDARISTLDLFGRDFVLLAAEGGDAWCEAARKLARRTGIPLSAHRVGGDVEDPSGALGGAYGIGRDGAVLVRPDGFIAFRARTARAAPEDVLADALARILVAPALRAAGRGVSAAPWMHG